MKLSTLSRTVLLISILLPIFIGCSSSKEKKVVIVFEKPPILKQEHELISNLPNHLLNENLSEFLTDQNWIDSFLIKRQMFKSVEIFIKAKTPKYIWRDKFYLDSNLTKFLYFAEYTNLLHLDMPIELVNQWLQFEDQFYALTQSYNLKIYSVTFNESEGWFFHTETNLRVNLGGELSQVLLEKFSLSLKYIFEKNLTPSIIDLRYKNGAALNYGK